MIISEQWENLLNPEILKERLINISMYIIIYEMLKNSIINRIKDFYIMCISGVEDIEGLREYKNCVLSKDKNHLYASIYWLQEHEVINEQDIKNIEVLKGYRNHLAHGMDTIVFSGEIEGLSSNFILAYQLINKIENWWIINFEMDLNPLFEEIKQEDIDFDGIQSGKKIMIDMVLSVLAGNGELLKKLKEGMVETNH